MLGTSGEIATTILEYPLLLIEMLVESTGTLTKHSINDKNMRLKEKKRHILFCEQLSNDKAERD